MSNSFLEEFISSAGTTGLPPVNMQIGDSEVKAAPPLGTITHEQTGFTGLDFVPSVKTKFKRESRKPEPPVFVEPGEEDYIPPAETRRRSKYREELTKTITQELLSAHSTSMKKYEKALAFVIKYKDAPDNGPDILEKLERANAIVKEGMPLTEEQARVQAMYKAATTMVPLAQ